MLKKTLLIADDDREFLKLEEKFLIRAGYHVLCAQDAYRALHLALTESPSLLLLDVNMPAGDGLSVHQRMRQIEAVRSIPVIYITGLRSEAVKVAARKMGAFAIMYKPFEFEVLLSNIKAATHESDLGVQPAATAECVSHALWSVGPKNSLEMDPCNCEF